jgi:CheY-like chemotaxis protein
MKVLLVDDNPKIRQMVKRRLAGAVDEFYECSDGAEALAAYTKYHPDWVLMDIVMEKTDGITATEEIKRHYPDAKVLILTQHNEPRLAAASKRAGAEEFVLKENLTELESIIVGTPRN